MNKKLQKDKKRVTKTGISLRYRDKRDFHLVMPRKQGSFFMVENEAHKRDKTGKSKMNGLHRKHNIKYGDCVTGTSAAKPSGVIPFAAGDIRPFVLTCGGRMEINMINLRKVAVIGCGFVGSASAFALMQSGLFSEMVLLDADSNKAEGEALDISHGLPFARPMSIKAGTYDDMADSSIVIVTAGAGQKPGETRLDLVKKNVHIFQSIIPEIASRGFEGILLIVANPVDILTTVAARMSGLPENRVFGSGTVLDTARLKYLLGERLSVDNRSVHAFIIGEHGDSEIAAWSSANVSGIPLNRFCEMRGFFDHQQALEQIAESVKTSAYEIIEKKKATYYGIAMSVRRICEAIMRDEKSILPVSSIQHSQNIDGIALSMPVIVGKDGVEKTVPISLSWEEESKLIESAKMLKKVVDSCNEA